jgi:selenocysteine-specific elongation factor
LEAAPAPGAHARVQLVFETPVCAMPGDRFIVRDAQAAHTLGGGLVLDPLAPARRRRSAARRGYLDALEELIAAGSIAALLQQSPGGMKLSELVRLTGLPVERLSLPPEALRIAAAPEPYLLMRSHWAALRERAVDALRSFHEQAPGEPGPDAGRLRRIAAPTVAAALWQALIEELLRERLFLLRAPWLYLPGHSASLSEPDRALASALQPLLAAGRFDPPWVRSLAVSTHQPEERVRQVLRKLVTQGRVYQVVQDLFYDADRIGELATIAGSLAQQHGTVSAACYRDALGLGRKRTIQILEFFDRIGYTRRVRDTRVLRRDSGWRVSLS